MKALDAQIELEQLAHYLDAARELWRTHRELVEQDEDPVPGIMARAEEAWKNFEVLRNQWPDKGRPTATAH